MNNFSIVSLVRSPLQAGARRGLSAAALSLLILAGCAATETADDQGADLESSLPARALQPDDAAETSEAADAFGLDPDPTAVVRKPAEPVIDDDPEQLLGLGPNGLFVLLGEPQLIRREAPAQVWQYRGLACVFDVVLYRRDEIESVTYIEARDSQGNKTPPRPCLNELLRARLAS